MSKKIDRDIKALRSIWQWVHPVLLMMWAMIILAFGFWVFPGAVTYNDWYLTSYSTNPIAEFTVGWTPTVILLAVVFWSVKTMYNGIKLFKKLPEVKIRFK